MNKVRHRPTSIIFIILMSLFVQPTLADEQSNSDSTYLHVARDQLSLAFEQYNAGNIDASKQSLGKASDWLYKAVTHSEYDTIKTEADKLASQIDSFRQTLGHTSEKNDISGFWHQATSLIIRESEQLIHSYIKSSNDNATLKHLLDAKMHFYLAEHDLFVSHDSSNAIQELNDSLTYLDQADKIARSELEPRINNIINNIKTLISLTESSKILWKRDVVIGSLDKAIKNITSAESIATPPVRLKLKLIEQNISELKLELQRTNLKTRYDSIMSDFARVIKNI